MDASTLVPPQTPLHTFEQHSAAAPHPAPSGKQGGGGVPQKFPKHVCEQHCVACVHGVPSGSHLGTEVPHEPFVHAFAQHSLAALHGLAAGLHTGDASVLASGVVPESPSPSILPPHAATRTAAAHAHSRARMPRA